MGYKSVGERIWQNLKMLSSRQAAMLAVVVAFACLGFTAALSGRAASPEVPPDIPPESSTTADKPVSKPPPPPPAAPVKPPIAAKVPAAVTGHQGGPLRLIFYYPWFPQTWGGNLADPFTNYKPSFGYYSSDDAQIVARHIQAMRYARMNVAISSWWGQGQQNEQNRFPVQLSLAQGSGLAWSLYYEKEGFGNPPVSELRSDLQYIKDRYTGNPNYQVMNQKPTIYVYGDDADNCGMSDRWKQANAEAGNSFHVVLKVFNGYRSCGSQPFSWHQYSPAVAADSQAGIAYAISAGFWKKGEPAILNRDHARWTQNVKDMVASRAPMQYVATFNEWGEGTAVESADQWASPSGYGLYLDALHNHIPAN